MIDKDPMLWEEGTWIMVGISASIAYLSRLLDRIHNKRVKSAVVELIEFLVCVGIAFGVYFVSTFFSLDERIVWLTSVYLGHKGTRWVFSKLDPIADSQFRKYTEATNHDSGANKDNA